MEIPNDSKCVLTLDNGKALELPTVAGGASVLQHVDVEMSDVYQSFRRFAYYNIKAKELKKIGKTVSYKWIYSYLPETIPLHSTRMSWEVC